MSWYFGWLAVCRWRYMWFLSKSSCLHSDIHSCTISKSSQTVGLPLHEWGERIVIQHGSTIYLKHWNFVFIICNHRLRCLVVTFNTLHDVFSIVHAALVALTLCQKTAAHCLRRTVHAEHQGRLCNLNKCKKNTDQVPFPGFSHFEFFSQNIRTLQRVLQCLLFLSP